MAGRSPVRTYHSVALTNGRFNQRPDHELCHHLRITQYEVAGISFSFDYIDFY
jgi:hypothetical protein